MYIVMSSMHYTIIVLIQKIQRTYLLNLVYTVNISWSVKKYLGQCAAVKNDVARDDLLHCPHLTCFCYYFVEFRFSTTCLMKFASLMRRSMYTQIFALNCEISPKSHFKMSVERFGFLLLTNKLYTLLTKCSEQCPFSPIMIQANFLVPRHSLTRMNKWNFKQLMHGQTRCNFLSFQSYFLV